MIDLITIVRMFIYSTFFVRERMFLCPDEHSSVRFPNKREDHKIMFLYKHWDKTQQLRQSNVVYEFMCPCCNSSFIRKTNRTLFIHTQEHALTDKEIAAYKHLRYCAQIKHIQGCKNYQIFSSMRTFHLQLL